MSSQPLVTVLIRSRWSAMNCLFPGTHRSSDAAFFFKLVFQVSFPERLLQLADTLFQSSFLGGISLEAVFDILLSPIIQKPGGNAVSPAEMGRGTDPAQIFFNDLTLEFCTEPPSHTSVI